jgi:hypothetical protein
MAASLAVLLHIDAASPEQNEYPETQELPVMFRLVFCLPALWTLFVAGRFSSYLGTFVSWRVTARHPYARSVDRPQSSSCWLACHLQACIENLHWTIAEMLLCKTQRIGLGDYTRPCKSLGIPWILLATLWIRSLWPRLGNNYRVN